MGIGIGRKRRYAFFFLILLCAAFLLFISPSAQGLDSERTVIRVGYPVQKGLTDFDEDGTYAGYTYEFLQEIAQFTGWKYEFVLVPGGMDEQLETLLDMLETGEIDLMGGMIYNESIAQIYDFAAVPYGSSSYVLCTLEENTYLSSSNYNAIGPLRIALITSAETANNQLDQFAQMCGFEVEPFYCASEEEQLEAMRSGQADAMLSIDINTPEGVRIITPFSPRPFYFAATKGKKDIISALTSALNTITSVNPYFITDMHERYFGETGYHFILTEDEKEYISKSRTLRVAVPVGKAPIQYVDKATRKVKGVSVDILEYVAEKTGLRFQYIPIQNEEELTQMLAWGQIDIVAGLSNDRSIATNYGCTLTIPYMRTALSAAINDDQVRESLKDKRLALLDGFDYRGDYLGVVQHYPTTEACLQAVQSGEADYCYINTYSAEYYIDSYGYNNLTIISQPDQWSQKLCFGLAKPVNLSLLSIINKSIQSVSNDALEMMIYRNADISGSVTLLSYIRANVWQACGIALFILLVLSVSFLLWYLLHSRKANRCIAVAYERYQQLSDLSNEFLFEYDVMNDTLLLTERSASFFKCGRRRSRFIEEIRQAFRDGTAAALAELAQLIENCQNGTQDIRCTMPNGENRWLRITTKLVSGEKNRPEYLIGKVLDIHEEHQRAQILTEKSQTDGLTGLLNAVTTHKQIAALLETGAGTGAMFIMDIDKFKDINDAFGHYTGDDVLKAIAAAMRETFGGQAVLGRLGGDEFAIYMPNTDKNAVAEKCRLLYENTSALKIEGMEGANSTLSIGVALTIPGQTFDALYRRADHALYDVKRHGRNGFKIADETESAKNND